MAIRIVRNQDGNCITFQGSTNPVYWNACLSAEVDAENPDRINVINDIRSADGPTVYEFFKIPFTEFRDADGNSFATAQDAADYITVNARVVDVTTASYRGVWDANTNTPALSDGDTPNRGDFYYVSTNGSTTLGGISTWRRGDRIIWNGTAWQKLEATSVVDANTRTTLLDTQVSVFADGEHAAKDPQGAPGWYYQNTENNKINWYFYGDTDVTSYSYGDFGGAYMVVDIRTQGSQLFWNLYTKPELDGEDQEFWYRSRVVYDNASGMQASTPGRYLVHTSNLDVTGIEPLLPRISLPVEPSVTVGPLGGTEEVYLMALSTSSGLAAGTNEFVVEKVGMKLGDFIQAYDLVAVPTTSAQAGATTPTTIDFERDVTGTTISDDAGQQFGVNTIRAVGNGDNTIDIINDKTGEVIYDNLDMTQIQVDGTSAGNTESAIANALNSLFFNTPLGDGGSYVPTFPTIDAADITYTVAEGILPTTEITPGTNHLYGAGADTSGHGARLWSTETIDTAGEYFLVKVIGNGRFIIGFADGTTDSDTSGTADDLEELANNSGSAASGLFWSQAFYDYGSYSAPWTWYGSSASGSYGPGWSGASTGMMRYNNDVQAALIAGSGSGVLFKAGIDSQGYLAVWYWDEGRSDDWIMCSRRSTATPGDRDYHLVVKLWNGSSTLVEIPQRVATDPVAPALNYRFIESPDGVFHYPLFATAEEAEFVDTANGGSGTAHAHVYVDEPTNTTWYMPDNGGLMAQASAPLGTAEITYSRIDTEADSLHTPSAFTMQDLTVNESGQVNYQVAPQGLTNWTTTVTGLPAGLSFDGATLIQGQAPFVSGDNVSNPSDVFTVTVTRTNTFGSTSASFDITVLNTTQPSVAVTGFEALASGSQSGSVMGDVDGAEDAAVQISQLLEPGKRMIFSTSWTETNAIPYVQGGGNEIFIGVADPAADWADVDDVDFDAHFKLEGTASASSYLSKIKTESNSYDSMTINSATDAFYDYALEWDGNDLHVIACNFNSINAEPGLTNGGQFSRTLSETSYAVTGDLPVYIGVDGGGQVNLDAVGITVIDIPLGANDFQVVEQSHNSATFNGSAAADITLNAGYTYRFMLNDASIHVGDTLTFETLDGTAYTTGVSTVGSHGDYLYYVEFQVPTDVPPLNILLNGTVQGAVGISGSTYVVPVTGITKEGPTANQTGTNVMDAGEHGWISLNEQLSAGERLVMDNAFWTDFLAELNESTNQFAIGLKGDNWTNTKEVSSAGAASTGEFFKGDTYIVGSVSGGNYIYFRIYSNGVASNQMLVNTTALHSTVCAFLEITNSGNSIRAGFGRNNSTGNITAGDESTVAYADWNAYKGQTGDQGYGITSKDVVVSFWTYSGGAIDGADVDWTGLSEVAVPTPAATLTTPWTKALDFSGSSERTLQVNNNYLYSPLKMGGLGAQVSGHSSQTDYTSDNTNSRPWATAIVFSSDNNNSNQHIWNCGDGAGSTDDNIYLRMTGARDLYFGWGRSSSLNECYLGNLASGSGNWYGIYIAHTGERLSASNAIASNLADCFDIYSVNLSTGAVGSNMSTASNWYASGGRMDREFTGEFTVGGRGGNRNFHGKVASMVVTTLRRNVAMPTDAEISMMVRDPEQWLTDYKVGNSYRRPSVGTDNSNFQLGNYDPSSSTQVWLMGDGTSDAYAQIRNQVFASEQNRTPMNMISMVSNDIETVSIPGLT